MPPPPEYRPPSGLRAPPLTWRRGCAPERPRISDRRTVRLALSSVSGRFSSAGGPQAFEGAVGLRCPSPRQSFPAAGALQLGRGNFHWARSPAVRSTERGASRLQRRLLESLGTAASLPVPGHEAGWRRRCWMAQIRPSSRLIDSPSLALGLHAANLPIPPAALAVRVQRGPAQRPLLPSPGGCPDRRLRRAPALRGRGLAQKDPGHVAGGKKERDPPPAPAASAQRDPEAEEAPAAAALKRRPGGCCYPTPPTPGACNALGPASARLLPARSGLVRAAVCRPGSSPFTALPSSSACPTPSLLSAPDSRRHLLRGWRCDPVQGGAAGAAIREPHTRALGPPGARLWRLIRSSPEQRETARLSIRFREELVVKVWPEIPSSSPAVSTGVLS
ncbi:hypothetical protein NN561_016653 [Cricetulus griseus]